MSLMEEAQSLRERISERLRELAPLVAEYEQLLAVAQEMGLDAEALVAAAPTDRPVTTADRSSEPTAPEEPPAPRRAAARRPSKDSGGSSRSRRGGGDLGAQMLAAVSRAPGGTVAEYAEQLGVTAAVLYRPVRELTSDGLLVKRGRQLLVP